MREHTVERGLGRGLSPKTIFVLGAVLIAAYAEGIMFAAGNYDTLVSLILGPALLFVSLPALSRQAARENDRALFWLLLLALMVKLAIGAVGQLYVIDKAYGGVADATGYYREGWRLAQRFRHFNFTTGLHPLVGTNFIHVLTGYVLAVLGSARTAAFLFLAWMGFWGLFLFYRAFVIAVPEGRSRSYARLLFFLPSLVFWPSAIGKDAWMVLSLGVVAFGSAHVLTDHAWRGLAIASLGFWMAVMVRPHVAALTGVALAVAYVLRRPRWELRELALVAKAASCVAVAVVAFVVLSRSNAFLRESGYSNPTDVNAGLSQVGGATSTGGSSFSASPLTSPKRAPAAALTVVFRPIITDAETSQELIAGIEGTFLLLLTLARFRWIIAALRSAVRQPYVVLATIHTGLFILAFSSFSNFGLLVRQRASLMPFFLILLCIPPRRRAPSDEGGPATAREAVRRA